jgi:hypothetical protein
MMNYSVLKIANLRRKTTSFYNFFHYAAIFTTLRKMKKRPRVNIFALKSIETKVISTVQNKPQQRLHIVQIKLYKVCSSQTNVLD